MTDTLGTGSGFHEELRVVRVPNDARRSRSTGTPGYDRDLLRGASGLLGPSESRPATAEDLPQHSSRPSSRADLRAQVAASATEAVVSVLTPYVERAIELAIENGIDGVSRLVGWAKRRAAERKVPAADAVVVAELVAEEPGPRADLEEPGAPITGEEYRARFLAALAAERYAAQEKERLARVRVVDDVLSPELQVAWRSALERPASSLDEETLAAVVEFLDGAGDSGGQYLLLDEEGAARLHREVNAGGGDEGHRVGKTEPSSRGLSG